MAVLIYPVDCVYFCSLRGCSTTVCALIAGRACLRLAQPLPPLPPLPSTQLLIYNTHDITEFVKKLSQNQQRIMCGTVSYETLAIRLLYLYSKSDVATIKLRRSTVSSIFQNGISRNTKCDSLVDFLKSSHT